MAQNIQNKHGLGIEFFGKSDIYAIHYTYNLNNQINHFRVGIGYQPGTFEIFSPNDRSFFYIPIEFNKSFFEPKHRLNISISCLHKITLYHPYYFQINSNPRIGAGYMLNIKNNFVFRADLNLNLPLYLAMNREETYIFTTNRFFIWPGILVTKCF
ncbi:MAG: hypothetical protein ACK4K9_03635 [Bacteroidia bacterium]